MTQPSTQPERRIAAEIARDEQLIIEPGLREVVLDAEGPYHTALEAVAGIEAGGVAEDILTRAQTEGYVAAHAYLAQLTAQVQAICPEDDTAPALPAETERGTPFVAYAPTDREPDSHALRKDAFAEKIAGMLVAKHDIRAAAVIATSQYTTKYLLSRELDLNRSTANSLLNRFEYYGLVAMLGDDERPEGIDPRAGAFAHTTRFDEIMKQAPGWQQATQLRTLAHRLQVPEEEAITRLLSLASLLHGPSPVQPEE